MMKNALFVLALAALFGVDPVQAQSDRDERGGSIGVSAIGSTESYGVAIDGRWILRRGVQLGASVSTAHLVTAYVGGQPTHDAIGFDARALALVPLLRVGAVELDLRLSSGVRLVRDPDDSPTQASDGVRSSTEIAMLAHVRLGERLLLRAGVTLVFELETRPTVALADQMQLLTFGLGASVGPRVLLHGVVDAGGSYGFDGDNGKVVVRGALGLRIALGERASARAPF